MVLNQVTGNPSTYFRPPPQEIKHLRSFLYADDLKLLAIQQSTENISEVLAALGNWINVNKMRLAEDRTRISP